MSTATMFQTDLHVGDMSPKNASLAITDEQRIQELIVLIAESIEQKQRKELIEYLDEFGKIVGIQLLERIAAYNARIGALLKNLQQHDIQGNWNNQIVVHGALHNTQKVFIESLDTRTRPTVEMILALPVSHDGVLPGHQGTPVRDRELMILRIYGISIENMNQVLSQRGG